MKTQIREDGFEDLVKNAELETVTYVSIIVF